VRGRTPKRLQVVDAVADSGPGGSAATGTRGVTASAVNAVSGASVGGANAGSMAQVGNAVRALVAQPAPAKPQKPALAEVGAAVKAEPLRTESKWAPAGTASASAAPVAAKPAEPDRATIARMKGYQGDSCGECGNFTLVRNGTCLKCDTCGSTTGCS
jgi:ribonucleoside-diphosphate reductase alpha chain